MLRRIRHSSVSLLLTMLGGTMLGACGGGGSSTSSPIVSRSQFAGTYTGGWSISPTSHSAPTHGGTMTVTITEDGKATATFTDNAPASDGIDLSFQGSGQGDPANDPHLAPTITLTSDKGFAEGWVRVGDGGALILSGDVTVTATTATPYNSGSGTWQVVHQ